jgi:hypothetical protein
MLNKLAKIANKLDSLGLTKEADVLDRYLQKAAQQVATTGVAGAAYGTSPMERGRQITPGKPGGAVIKFYKAKPKSIGEFNTYLAALIDDVAKTDILNQIFSRATVSNSKQLSTQTNWSSLTASAFKEYAEAVRAPEAGIDWQKYAKSHNYEPTMSGIYVFWADTVERAIELGGKQEGKIPVFEEEQATKGPSDLGRDGRSLKSGPPTGPDVNLKETERFIRKMTPKINPNALRDRLYGHFTGGRGISIWLDEKKKLKASNDTRDALALINGVQTPEAKAWFAQDSKVVLPDMFLKGIYASDIYEIKTWAIKNEDAGVPNFNEEVRRTYVALAEIFRKPEN